MEMKEEKNKKQALNLEELDKVSGGNKRFVADDYNMYTCPECSKEFYNKKDGNQHLKEVHGYKEDLFK